MAVAYLCCQGLRCKRLSLDRCRSGRFSVALRYSGADRLTVSLPPSKASIVDKSFGHIIVMLLHSTHVFLPANERFELREAAQKNDLEDLNKELAVGHSPARSCDLRNISMNRAHTSELV